jgi:hypothetical protein
MEIVSATSNFDFKTASLADPQPLTGQAGFYFTQLTVGPENKSLCLQLPECVTKQGIVNIKNAKYADLMFERDTHDELMKWVEKLEYTCQDIIDTKKELWFQTELTRDDIETMMTQITRLYQSGKYVLMRVFIDANKAGAKCIAYDENEIGFDLDTLEANKSIIPLMMIEGVKFSSRSFEISLKLIQVMVLGKDEKKSSCLIKRPNNAPAPAPVLEKTVVKKTEQPINTNKVVRTPLLKPVQQQPIPNRQVVIQKESVLLQKEPVVLQKEPVLLQKEPLVKKEPVALVRENTVISKSNPSLGERIIKPILKNVSIGSNTVGLINATVGKDTSSDIKKTIVKKNDIEEITINYKDLSDSISLRNPNEVYYEIYKNAREKAKQCRIKAVEAYLEAKQIKTKYMLQDLDDSDDDGDDSEEDDIEYENGEE